MGIWDTMGAKVNSLLEPFSKEQKTTILKQVAGAMMPSARGAVGGSGVSSVLGSAPNTSLRPGVPATSQPPDAPKEKVEIEEPIDQSTKELFASMETSGETIGDYLQLEKSTFEDLKRRGKIRSTIEWEDTAMPEIYEEVAGAYLDQLQNEMGIPTLKEAALWSYRPSYYKQFGGNIENIPDDKVGSFGKTAKEVMRDRKKNMDIHLRSE